jgi:hypothetical protein
VQYPSFTVPEGSTYDSARGGFVDAAGVFTPLTSQPKYAGDTSGTSGDRLVTKDATGATGAAPDGRQVMETDPGYQLRLSEGLKALERSAASKGTLLTGGTLKGLTEYAGKAASDEYANLYSRAWNENNLAYNRALTENQQTYGRGSDEYTRAYNKALGEYQQAFNVYNSNQGNQYNRLAGLAGLGQNSASSLNSTGLGYSSLYSGTQATSAANQGNYLTSAANANAAGTVGSANAWNTALGNVGKGWSDYLAGYFGNQNRQTGYGG